MATTIAIICTLDELTAYSLADGNNRYFGLNISAGLRGSAAPGAAAAPILQAWTLKSVTPAVYVDAGNSGGMPNGQSVSQQIKQIAPAPIDVSAVTARLMNRYTGNAANGDYFNWADAPDIAATTPPPGESWPRLVAHASTYPAPIPQSLNLAFVFSLPNGSVLTPGRMFAAITIVTADNITYAPNGAPLKPVNGFAEWQYSSAPAGYSLSAFQAEYLVKPLPNPLPAPHYYDPNTGWIATASGQDITTPAESNSSEDWRTTFERRVAEAFDLGQRMIVVLRANATLANAHPTYLQVDQARDCVLAALRDTTDFGLRYGPDGTNLLRFVLARSNVTDPSVANAIETALIAADTIGIADWETKFLVPDVGNVLLRSGQADNALADPAYIQATLDMLDKVQSLLAGDAMLAQLLYGQWNTYLGSNPNWQAVAGQVQQTLGTLSKARLLRTRFLLGNVGGQAPGSPLVPIWNQLTATDPGTDYTAETQKIATNLQNLVGGYFHGRFGSAVADQYSQYFTGRMPAVSWPSTLPDLYQKLKDDAATFASSLFPDNTQPTRASHPVILQIADTTDAPVTPDQDPERKLSGVGLLIQEQADPTTGTPVGPWTCANTANLYIAGQAGPNPLVPSVPAPIRLHARNKLKQSILAYNNASLVAQDPNDPHVQDFSPQGGVYPPETGSDWGQMFQYQTDQAATPATVTVTGGNFTIKVPQYSAPTDDAKGWSRIPALKYGKQYKLLPFLIGNGGTLPPLMTVVKNPQFTLASPFAPVAPSAFATNWTGAALQGYTRTVTYKRRVAVGAPRLKKADGSGTYKDQFPAIPAGVVPIARDYLGAANSSSPVLLLWGTGSYSKFTFQVRPPACDLETWDRWVAGWSETQAQQTAGLFYRNTRIYVASAAGRFSSKTNDANGPDISIDDPAIGSLNLTLTPVYSDTPASAVQPQTWQATLPPPMASSFTGPSDNMLGSLMGPVQSAGFTIACSIGPVKFVLAGGVLTVQVPEGEVWRLTAAPALNVAVGDYFEGFAASNLGTLDVLIESATQGSFAPGADASAFQDVLWDTFAPSFGGTQLKVELDGWGDLTKRDKDRDLVRNVELQRQMWRWMGRPIAPLPSDWGTGGPPLDNIPAIAGGIPNSRLWEIGSFAERLDSDCIVSQVAVNYAYKDLTTTPPPKTQYALLQQDLSVDMRAQYHRFGITVHSRYEGLAAVTPAADSLQVIPIQALKLAKNQPAPGSGGSGYTAWKRCIVPPRVAGEIPKPKILLVIPLTAPDSTGTSRLPDLLAIANEPWFTIGGLAEELHAQLDLARDPSVPLSVPDSLANPIPEIGPNAILTVSPMDQSLIVPPVTGTPVAGDPIGTTFDLNTMAPLFGNTCFRVKAPMLRVITNDQNNPTVSVLPASGLERHQAKVQFTRFINGALIGQKQPDLESKATDPFWVEFQPSFQHCSVQGGTAPVPIADLRFSISGGALVFNPGANPVVPVAGPPQSNQLQLWALLMTQIVDAAGNQQTAALDMIGPTFQTTQTDSANIVVYLLEVLCEPGSEQAFTGGIANAAKLLFPDSDGADPNAKARIYRCSAPIQNIAPE